MEKKAYAVVWVNLSAIEYGVESGSITVVSPEEPFKVPTKNKIYKRGFYYGAAMAIFYKKAEAVAYCDGNKDWKVIPIKLTYKI